MLSLSKSLHLFDFRVDYEKAGRSLRHKVFNLPRKPLSQVRLSGIHFLLPNTHLFLPKDQIQIQQSNICLLILLERRERGMIFQENNAMTPDLKGPSSVFWMLGVRVDLSFLLLFLID